MGFRLEVRQRFLSLGFRFRVSLRFFAFCAPFPYGSELCRA